MNPFSPWSWFSNMFGLGLFGLVIFFVIWAIGTMVTGFFLGLGIWAAMPRAVKLHFRR